MKVGEIRSLCKSHYYQLIGAPGLAENLLTIGIIHRKYWLNMTIV